MHLIKTTLLLLAASVSVPSYAAVTCAELAIFARVAAFSRDNGNSLARVQQIVDEDPNFIRSDKKALKLLAKHVFASPSVGPTEFATLALNECLKTATRTK